MKVTGITAALIAVLTLAACGGDAEQTDRSAKGAGPQTGTDLTPDAGRAVIEVEMLTDDNGDNVFRPADFDVQRGDVVRFVLVNGVHNAHFVADSAPGVQGLPAAGPLLQLPGQTWDVKVNWQPGRYFYQCDPHALIGMVGHMTVRDD
jgi:plastocyanin